MVRIDGTMIEQSPVNLLRLLLKQDGKRTGKQFTVINDGGIHLVTKQQTMPLVLVIAP